MSEVLEETKGRDAILDGPAVSHYGWAHNRTVALCGAPLIGVPAPETHEPRCAECERLHLDYLRDVFGGNR